MICGERSGAAALANSTLPNDPLFTEVIMGEMCFYLNTNNKDDVPLSIKWDALKDVLKEKQNHANIALQKKKMGAKKTF